MMLYNIYIISKCCYEVNRNHKTKHLDSAFNNHISNIKIKNIELMIVI